MGAQDKSGPSFFLKLLTTIKKLLTK